MNFEPSGATDSTVELSFTRREASTVDEFTS